MVQPRLARLIGLLLIAVAVTVSAQQAPGAPGGGGRGAGPQTVPEGGFFFVQLSDTQFGFSNADRDFIQDTVNAEFAVATVNRLKPAFVVVTGDLVNKPGDAGQIAEYQRIVQRLDSSIPLYSVAGNHDVGNEPTPASVAAYVRRFGPDHYAFTVRNLTGLVLDSSLIHSPDGAPELAAAQERWLRDELTRTRGSGTKHVVIFQHHPWFLRDAAEPDEYFNVPLARRRLYLDLFRSAGVRHVLSGHYHRNALAADGDLQMITTGPVGMPLGEGTQSGVRVAIVTDGGITHRYYGLGELPNLITLPER